MSGPIDGTMFGDPAERFRWETESGEIFLVKDIRPVVDEHSERLFGVLESEVLFLHEAPRDLSINVAELAQSDTLWGPAENWTPLHEKMVNCSCHDCTEPALDMASSWRITYADEGIILARLVLTDPSGETLEIDEHSIYESPELLLGAESDKVEIDTFMALIAIFGEPYDLGTGGVNPPYMNIYEST